MNTLKDRVAVVTGASRGLGKAIALELGKEGATLVLIGRDGKKLQETGSEATELGADAHTFVTDVTSSRSNH